MGVTVTFGVAPPARLGLAFAPECVGWDLVPRGSKQTKLLGHVLFSLPLIERQPEPLVPYQEFALALAPPVGHYILHLPPRATSRVDYPRFRLSIFFRWAEVGGSRCLYGRRRSTLTTVLIRPNQVCGGICSSIVLIPRNSLMTNGPINFGKNFRCSPRKDMCSDDSSTDSPCWYTCPRIDCTLRSRNRLLAC
jgi:hypothetical protein